jgi:hypothetical protein
LGDFDNKERSHELIEEVHSIYLLNTVGELWAFKGKCSSCYLLFIFQFLKIYLLTSLNKVEVGYCLRFLLLINYCKLFDMSDPWLPSLQNQESDYYHNALFGLLTCGKEYQSWAWGLEPQNLNKGLLLFSSSYSRHHTIFSDLWLLPLSCSSQPEPSKTSSWNYLWFYFG